MNDLLDSRPSQGWDTYWRGAKQAGAYSAGGVSHPAVIEFWDATLGKFLAGRDEASVLDIASGSGAVIERLITNAGAARLEVSCVDISAAAIDGVVGRFPEVTGVVADAKSIPLESARFDLVCSQFGVEYAGLEAVDEAARLLASGGEMILLMHHRGGVIHAECAAALDAVRRTRACGFVELSLKLMDAAFAALRGAARDPYDRAALDLNPAIESVEAVLAEHGQQVAGGTIADLYANVGRIHDRIQYHDPDEVTGWLKTMREELSDYEDRMASMCDAAVDAGTFEGICDNLRSQGLEITTADALPAASGQPAVAWMLAARRRSATEND